QDLVVVAGVQRASDEVDVTADAGEVLLHIDGPAIRGSLVAVERIPTERVAHERYHFRTSVCLRTHRQRGFAVAVTVRSHPKTSLVVRGRKRIYSIRVDVVTIVKIVRQNDFLAIDRIPQCHPEIVGEWEADAFRGSQRLTQIGYVDRARGL